MSCKRALFVFLTLVFVLSFMQEPVSGQTCYYECYTDTGTIENSIQTDCSSCSPSNLCDSGSYFYSSCEDGLYEAQWYTSDLENDYSVNSESCPSYITVRMVNGDYYEGNTLCFGECCIINDVTVTDEPFQANSDGYLYQVDDAAVAEINADCFVGTIAWRIVGNRWSINGESTDEIGIIVYIQNTGSICAY
jgi:hypothetical protein